MSLDKQFPVDKQIVSSLELLNRDYRLDPSRYNESGESMIRHLKKHGLYGSRLSELPEFIEVYIPNRFSRIYLDDNNFGAPMVGTSTMFMTHLPADARIRIKGDIASSPLLIQFGDILVSRSGTIGTAVLCGKSYSSFVASDHCFRLRIKEHLRGYVAAYLSCPFGKTLLTRDGHGKVIRELKDHDIENICIPIVEKTVVKRINDLMIESMRCIDDARDSFTRAELELCSRLGFQGSANQNHWFNAESKTFLKTSGELSNYRIDPHFYSPNISRLRKKLSAIPHKTLSAIADVWGAGRFKRLRADEGHGTPLYSSADIMRAIVTPSAHISSERNARSIKQCLVHAGTILIPCSGALGGILGRCVRAGKKLNKQAVSQHALRIKVTDTEYVPDYVVALLSSPTFGYPIITAFRYGKDVPELAPKDLKALPIPKLPKHEQEEIGSYISTAYLKLDRANQCEDAAQKELLESLQWDIEND